MSKRTKEIIIITLGMILVASVTAYVVSTYYPSITGYINVTTSSTGALKANSSQNTIDITGNSLTQTIPINTNSVVEVVCNFCQITFQIANSTIALNLDVSGNSNSATIISGQTNIVVTGNDNIIYASQTTVLNTSNTGNDNRIQR